MSVPRRLLRLKQLGKLQLGVMGLGKHGALPLPTAESPTLHSALPQ